MANALPPLTISWDDVNIGNAVLFSAMGEKALFDPLTNHAGKEIGVNANYIRVSYDWIEKERHPDGSKANEGAFFNPEKKNLDPGAPSHFVVAGSKLHETLEEELAKNHVQYSLVQYMVPDPKIDGNFNTMFIYYPDKEDTEKTRQIVSDINLARTSNFNEIDHNKLSELCEKMGRDVALHKNIPELEYEQMANRGIMFAYSVIKNKDGSVTLAFPNDPAVKEAEARLYNESHIFLSGQTGRFVSSLEKEFIDSHKSVMAHIANNREKTIVVDTMHPNRYLVADADSVNFYVRTPEGDVQERSVSRNDKDFDVNVYTGLKAYVHFERVDQKDLENKLQEVQKEHEREEVDGRVKMIAYKESLLPMTKQLVELTSMARLEEDRSLVRDIIEKSVRDGKFADLSKYLDKDAEIGNAMSAPTAKDSVETEDKAVSQVKVSENDISEIRGKISVESIAAGEVLYEQYFSEYGLSNDVKAHLETWLACEPAVQLLSQEPEEIQNVVSNDLVSTVDYCASERSEVIESLEPRDLDAYVEKQSEVTLDLGGISEDQEQEAEEEEDYDYDGN